MTLNPYNTDKELRKRTSCKECGVVYGSSNTYYSVKGSRGMCKPCYMRWMWQWGHKECTNCGRHLKTPTVVPYCKLCKKEIKDGLLERPNIKGIGKRRPKDEFNHPLDVVSRWDIMDIKLLLLRFKIGSQTPIDFYKVIHYYTQIWSQDTKLDGWDIETQMAYMLKRLKHFYETNTKLKPRGWY